MKLREIFLALSSAELSNLAVTDKGTGLINPMYYGKIINSINLGLTDLHTRFLLKTGKVTVNLQEGKTVYPIKAMYQEGNRAPADTVQFISADGTRLKNNLLKIQQVIAVHEKDPSGFGQPNIEINLNNHNNQYGIHTSSYDTLVINERMQKEFKVARLEVTYRMNAEPVCQCENDYDADCIEVDIEFGYLWALCLFVASRVHNPIGFGTDGVHEGNNYWAKYMAECETLNNSGMQMSFIAENFGRLVKGFP